MSIACFFSGAMIFSAVMRRVGALRRGTLFVSFMIQTILIIIAVALIGWEHVVANAESAGLVHSRESGPH